MELWEYILIVLGAEILAVAIILLIIWNFCKWSQSKKKESDTKRPPLVSVSTLTDDDMHDLFSRNAVVEYGKAPSHHGSLRYTHPKMSRELPVVEESLPVYRPDNATSLRSSPSNTESIASASKLHPKVITPTDSLRSTPDSGFRASPTGNRPTSSPQITKQWMSSSPLPEEQTSLKRNENPKVRFESLILLKKSRDRVKWEQTTKIDA